ncbi:uncharacterized protein LOC129741339 [Uranotaenia lowii]|uniref:uncharacterized protein LOC129741339 n=1 Tax=Uranotaenia lowii TaxID=190385 RepID=UPI0024793E59|nr:uncharacterized protein LOC129741339 [Uranotaenia lowii]
MSHGGETRKTRSQTKAIQEFVKANPKINEQAEGIPLSEEKFEPSFVDTNRGHEKDCVACDRRNDVERYMVQCIDCERWEHFSCAKVTTANAHMIIHRCTMCVPRIPPPPPSSVTRQSTTSSARRIRISRDLEQLEEERKLQEQAAKDQLERDEKYMSRKYKLLKQQDEEEIRSLKNSNRFNSSRVAEWVESQITSQSTGNNPKGFDEVQQTGENPQFFSETTSTPFMPRIIGNLRKDDTVLTTGSISVVERIDDRSEGTTDTSIHISPQIPSVNIQPYVSLLKEVAQETCRLSGVIPKVPRPPSFEQWRMETERKRKVNEIREQHEEENNVRRKRELELVKQIQRLEALRLEDQKRMDQFESGLRKQLDQERAEIHAQQRTTLEQQELELQRCLQVELQLRKQLKEANERRQTVPVSAALGPNVTERVSNNHAYEDAVQQLSTGNNFYPVSSEPPVSFAFPLDPSNGPKLRNDPCLISPMGGRSQEYALSSQDPSFSFMLPSAPQIQPHATDPAFVATDFRNVYDVVPPNPSVPTVQQLAARHVSKELPVFTGDPMDWPLFISTYRNSTEVCGYSESENLLRLQRSIKGIAKEAVSSFLLHPSTVPKVIHTLQTLYGKPEQIVHHMVCKVRASPAPKGDRMETLVSFGLMVQNLCSHLKAVGLENHLSNPTLLQELVAKLPPTAMFSWALFQELIPNPDLTVFGRFMERITSAASGVSMSGNMVGKFPKDERQKKDKGFINVHSTSTDVETNNYGEISSNRERGSACVACEDETHNVADCLVFRRFSLDERWNLVKERKLCSRCLRSHRRWPCRVETCGVNNCQKRHHKLLHYDPSPSSPTAVVTIHRKISASVLYRMLPVTLIGPKGKVETYAFLDDGSSVTLIENALAEKIGAEGIATSLCIQWTGGVNKTLSNTRLVGLQILGIGATKCLPVSEVYTVESLGLPEQSLNFDELKSHYQHLHGIHVKSFSSAVPGILIGLNNVHLLTSLKVREGRVNEPIATKSRIGWSVFGPVLKDTNLQLQHQMHMCEKQNDEDLHAFVQRFFEFESLGITVAPVVQGADDQRAYKILNETTKQTPNGKFEVGLLWRYDYIELPDSRPMAERRHRCLEKRLARNPSLYEKVRQQIADYQLKGYAHKATTEEMRKFDLRRTWYCPLGVVLNEKKPDKVRLIWDAAAKVDGVSLNSTLMKGPDLISSLLAILFRYRERKVAISADIKEMFHQILIREVDRSAQLFVWRDYPNMPFETMVMDVAIFGATCSPAHSQFVKNINAAHYRTKFPKASQAIEKSHYVDDCLVSVDTPEEAVELALQITNIHSKAGFQIVNWMSNDKTVVHTIGQVEPNAVKSLQFDKENTAERLLGMVWYPEKDVFSFSLNFREDVIKILTEGTVPTKREILKVVMSIYDPLGLISAFVIHGKIIIQDVWRAKIGWDEKISPELFSRWKHWLCVLKQMEKVVIPRCYFPGYEIEYLKSLQLHVFVDASEQAYAAVAYFRIVEQRSVRCVLVSSKTKVAPLQLLSVPRLELLAAVLGARLKNNIESEHSLQIRNTFLWSDSTTVLSWIRSDIRRYRPYVGHRINEILSFSNIQQWKWVPTRLNVADEATKWGKGPCFLVESRWFNAPEFLYDAEEDWPYDKQISKGETNEELRPGLVAVHTIVEPVEPLFDVFRFSKWERMLRCIGYVCIFIVNCRRQAKKNPRIDLNSECLIEAERVIWKTAQITSFSDEIAVLMYNKKDDVTITKKLSKSSSIASANPFLDEFGVMRLEGRLEAAEWLSYDAKHPVIMPKDNRITFLLLDWYHRNHRHANNETVVNEIRQRYYIPRLRVLVQQTSNKHCMWCRVYKARPCPPKMGPLPKARLTPHVRPFSFTGIDYFGPYYIKIGRAAVKRWVVLFTCLTVRAVHLEVAASLSTDSCKKAIRRFIGRRGAPQEIYTDNGTNFLGASRELQAELKELNEELGSTFTDTITQWYFIPPAAPHMGGCWERMVRSVKTALETIPTAHKLDEESLATVLVEAEHMINSRPLTFIPLKTAEEESLTPNHFLMLSSKGVCQGSKKPLPSNGSYRMSWDYIQRVLQEFWKRWVRSYLPTITRRTKWFDNVPPIHTGELVVIVDERVRNRWLRGRVLKTYPGKDGVSRRADVQTTGGIFNRPVSKLALLDVGATYDAEPDVLAT